MTEDAAETDLSVNERVRRPFDLIVAIMTAAAFAVILGVAHTLPLGSSELTGGVAHWLERDVPRAFAFVIGSLAGVGAFGFFVASAISMARHSRRDAINAIVAGVLGAGVALGFVLDWRSRSGGIASAMLHGTNATAFVVTVGFVAYVTGTDLARRPRWTRWCFLAVGPLLIGEFALNDLTLFATVAVPLMGVTVGLFVRWALGAASVRPGAQALKSWLDHHGIALTSFEPVRGKIDFEGARSDGSLVAISLANRDTRGAGVARRIWHTVRLRSTVTGAEALSLRSQLETQALASFIARSGGVVVPTVLLLAEFPPETLVLCVEVPRGAPLEANTAPEALAALFLSLRNLHRVGIAHRDLRADRIVVDGDGPGFSSLERAQTASGELVRRLDVAQLLTTAARLVGASAAVKAFRSGYEPENEAQIISVLQPIALAPWGWSAMRGATGCLTEVRHELVGTGEHAPPLRLERFRYRTVLSTVALTFAAFLLVGQFSKVNLLGEIGTMNPAWFLLAVAASAITYFAAALNLAAFVPKRLSMVRGFLVQLSSAFVGLVMPPTVGHVAVNGRYLHRQGVDDGAIAAAVAVSQIVNVVTTIPLLIIIGVLTGSGVSRFHIVPGTNILIGIAAIAGVIGVIMTIPRPRALVAEYIWPKVRSAIPRLIEAFSQPLRLAVGVGASLLLTIGYVVALVASLYAVGAHPPLLATTAVYLAGNAVGSIAPTPGGIGAVEAVMSAGLTAIGIPPHQAVPAVLIFRIATFWLPIPTGWVSYVTLLRSGTL